MNSNLARLRVAALVGIACAFTKSHADELWQYRTVTLSWEVPTTNVDGTPLTDLQGYYIYAGDAPEAMIPMYYANVPQASIVLRYWGTGTRYFAVSAVNVDGVESDMTGTVSQARQ